MNFGDLVRKARTCRRFVEGDPIPPDIVRNLIDAARLVPSGGNQQPLKYRLVTSPDECANVFPHLKWAAALKGWGGPAPGERPTGYVILLAPAGRNCATDIGIVGQTIQLGATAAGYAACMLGNIDRPAIAAALSIPAEYDIALVVALGRPGEAVVLEDLAPGAPVTYWRTADQVHHVPKRRLEDVIVP